MVDKVYKLKTVQMLIVFFISIAFIIILIMPFLKADFKYKSIDLTMVERTVEKYVIQCYATEGAYPPDLEYLSKNYGLILDREKYIYVYDVFSENVSPDVRVLVNNGYSGK